MGAGKGADALTAGINRGPKGRTEVAVQTAHDASHFRMEKALKIDTHRAIRISLHSPNLILLAVFGRCLVWYGVGARQGHRCQTGMWTRN